MKTTKYNMEESLGYALGRTFRSLGAVFNQNLAKAGFDVTCEQYSVLVNLGRKNGQTQQDLAGLVCKDKTTMTRLIDGMEKRNLVVRIQDKTDKRQKHIYLTKKGQDLQEKLIQVSQETLKQAQKGINIKDLETCKKVLHQVYENIKV